jgi:anaerobic selenocysteine-containing dehydrogenase
MSATARYAHYVVASKFALEVPQLTGAEGSINMYGATSTQFREPYAMYSPAVVAPPPGSDVVEEWEVLLAVAGRLGLTLTLGAERLEPGCRPTTDELYEMLFAATRVPLDDVKRYEHGHVFDEGPPVLVLPRADDCDLRLQLADPLVLEALRALGADDERARSAAYPFRLISRRMKNAKNSSGLDVEALFPNRSINPACMNPGDLERLHLTDGDEVRIRSERSWIPAVVAYDETVPSGVVSMAHAWGDGPDRDDEFRAIGSCTSRLVDNDAWFDPVTGMPVMTAIPVAVERL